ncbi:uncharacterized protein [Spinacia oleracea]|uniref:MATH domain-containing protein n=1 Tax=Spinacia oleracea TaxID=3562 RepID=A0A9R0K393_SPIOL|nr:uncharacterized protein LOC110796178 [Spinacia oleracea]
MYTTRPLSHYKSSPESLSIPPEGPNSGYLVIRDEKSIITCNLGTCTDPCINNLPFPQNMRLIVKYHMDVGDPLSSYTNYDEVCLIPVINQPLSCNRYYAIKADGKKNKGKAYTSSKEQDKPTCCFCFKYIQDIKPRPFDPNDIYQQFEFSVTKTSLNNNNNNNIMLLAKSVASDSHPPSFLRGQGWKMNVFPSNFTIGEARGVNSSLRSHLPDFNFALHDQECSKSVIVGKWYCPFMFIKEGKVTEKEQLEKSMFYEMTLEQRWELVFGVERNCNQGKVVTVDVDVLTETVKLAGQEAAQDKTDNDKGVVWFKTINGRGKDEQVGLIELTDC